MNGKYACTVTVHEARNLAVKDIGGKSDPFVKLHLPAAGGTKERTKIVKKNLNPKWEETFEFLDHHFLRKKTHSIELSVWDWDLIGSNDYMGELEITFFPSLFGQKTWFPLQKKPGYKGEVKGDICLTITHIQSKEDLADSIFIHLKEQPEQVTIAFQQMDCDTFITQLALWKEQKRDINEVRDILDKIPDDYQGCLEIFDAFPEVNEKLVPFCKKADPSGLSRLKTAVGIDYASRLGYDLNQKVSGIFVIDHLIMHGRIEAAKELLSRCPTAKSAYSWDKIILDLLSLLPNKDPKKGDLENVIEVVKTLQSRGDIKGDGSWISQVEKNGCTTFGKNLFSGRSVLFDDVFCYVLEEFIDGNDSKAIAQISKDWFGYCKHTRVGFKLSAKNEKEFLGSIQIPKEYPELRALMEQLYELLPQLLRHPNVPKYAPMLAILNKIPNGFIDVLQQIHDEGNLDVQASKPSYPFLLHISCEFNDFELTRWLLEHNANPLTLMRRINIKQAPLCLVSVEQHEKYRELFSQFIDEDPDHTRAVLEAIKSKDAELTFKLLGEDKFLSSSVSLPSFEYESFWGTETTTHPVNVTGALLCAFPTYQVKNTHIAELCISAVGKGAPLSFVDPEKKVSTMILASRFDKPFEIYFYLHNEHKWGFDWRDEEGNNIFHYAIEYATHHSQEGAIYWVKNDKFSQVNCKKLLAAKNKKGFTPLAYVNYLIAKSETPEKKAHFQKTKKMFSEIDPEW